MLGKTALRRTVACVCIETSNCHPRSKYASVIDKVLEDIVSKAFGFVLILLDLLIVSTQAMILTRTVSSHLTPRCCSRF